MYTNNLLVDKSLLYLSNLHIFFVRFRFKDRLKSENKHSKELCNAISWKNKNLNHGKIKMNIVHES